MKVKALVSFSGLVTMHAGEETVLRDSKIVADLRQAGYIEIVEKKDKGGVKKDEGE